MNHRLLTFVTLATDLANDDQWSPALVRKAETWAERQQRLARRLKQDR